MKRNKKILIALISFILLIGLFAGIYIATRPTATEGEKQFTVQVTHKDNSTKEISYQTDMEYLGGFLQAEGLIEGEMGQFGLYITVVDGESAIYEEDASYWSFYQNGEYANQGVDLTPIVDGDRYAFVYTYG